MGNTAVRLLPFVAVGAIAALLPVYLVDTTEYSAWFGPPGQNFSFANATTFHPFVEVLGGGLDWRTEQGACITDVGGWTHHRANPFLIAEFVLVTVVLSLLLLWGLASAGTERGRRVAILAVAGVLLVASVAWLVWYGLLAVTCTPDFGASRGLAAALVAVCLAIGLCLLAFRNALARESWRWRPRGSAPKT